MLLVRLLRLADVKHGLKVQKVEIRIKSIEMFDKITVSEIEKSFGAQSNRISRQKKEYKSLAPNGIRTKGLQCSIRPLSIHQMLFNLHTTLDGSTYPRKKISFSVYLPNRAHTSMFAS